MFRCLYCTVHDGSRLKTRAAIRHVGGWLWIQRKSTKNPLAIEKTAFFWFPPIFACEFTMMPATCARSDSTKRCAIVDLGGALQSSSAFTMERKKFS
jgi:hypothetical protein